MKANFGLLPELDAPAVRQAQDATGPMPTAPGRSREMAGHEQ